jgi:hypothetical protein
MASVFDKAFSQAADTLHDVFGEPASYTVKATGDVVSLKLTVLSLTLTSDNTDGGRADKWVLIGTLLKSQIPEPATGDTIVLTDDDQQRVYMLTETPTEATDDNEWQCEFAHVQPTRRGGQAMFPIY